MTVRWVAYCEDVCAELFDQHHVAPVLPPGYDAKLSRRQLLATLCRPPDPAWQPSSSAMRGDHHAWPLR